MKRCPKCGETKLSSGFYNNKGRKDGISSLCIICLKANAIAYLDRTNPNRRRGNRIDRKNNGVEKICASCEEMLPLDRFSKALKFHDGLNSLCRKCVSVHRKITDKKRFLAIVSSTDAEQIRAEEERALRRKERIRRCVKRIKENDREKYLADKRKYRKTHEDKRDRREYNRKYWQTIPTEVRLERGRNYRKTHPEKIREYNQVKRHTRRLLLEGSVLSVDRWRAIVSHYSPDGKCLRCGEVKPLTIDHVKPVTRGGKNDAGNLQPLCMRCNSCKGTKDIDFRPDMGAFARSISL